MVSRIAFYFKRGKLKLNLKVMFGGLISFRTLIKYPYHNAVNILERYNGRSAGRFDED